MTRSPLRIKFLALMVISSLCGPYNVQGHGTSDREWVELFNGETLAGWEVRGGHCDFNVVNGEIVAPSARSSFLCTKRVFKDFVLVLEVLIPPGVNSGIQIRSTQADEPTNFHWRDKTSEIPKGKVYGYQVEIDPSSRAWTGGLYEEGRRGWLVTLEKNDLARKAYRANEWNIIRVECLGSSIKTWINDVLAVDTTDDWPPYEGFIGLQVQGKGEGPLQVRFRNIRILEIKRP